jgi:hypothetical protein
MEVKIEARWVVGDQSTDDNCRVMLIDSLAFPPKRDCEMREILLDCPDVQCFFYVE